MELGSQHIEQINDAMYRVLLGTILWAIDIPIGGYDFFPDFAGTLLIALGGIMPLSSLSLYFRYRLILNFTFWMGIIYSVYEGFLFIKAGSLMINPYLSNGFDILFNGGLFLFCIAMMILCDHLKYAKTSKAWEISAITTFVVYASYFTIFPLIYRFIMVPLMANQTSVQSRESLISNFAFFQFYLSFLPFLVLACTLAGMLFALHNDPLKKTTPEFT